jgi:creatinine amidohydrolase
MEAPPATLPPPRYVEVHAGGRETSILWYNFPALVKSAMIPQLPDTKLGPEELAEWRKGGGTARALTPLGYLGDPASASLERGELAFHDEATRLANAILKHLDRPLQQTTERGSAGSPSR